MFQKTRFRLALWYTILTGILLLLFATGVYLYVRQTLVERIDDTLEHVVELMEHTLVREGIRTSPGTYHVDIAAGFPETARSIDDDRIDVEWFNVNQQLVWSTFEEPLDLPLTLSPHGKTITLTQDYQLRQITATIKLDQEILGYLRISHPWFEVTRPSRQLVGDLTIGILLMIACVASLGWFLSGIAMEPVKDSYQSLKQFTADASHELRNPLATIQTYIQMALADSVSEGKIQIEEQQLRVVERLTQRLGRLVNDLLFLARSDSGMLPIAPQPVPLDALLLEVVEEQRLYAKSKGLNLSLEIAATETETDPFTIQGDWDQLARLFTNLVSNAIEYTQARDCHPTPIITLNLSKIKQRGRNHLQVTIQDQGCGIPDTAIPQLFERFYRVDSSRSHKGSGLGLAIAKAIVDKHHGQIKVESQLNQGSLFTVILPEKINSI